MILVTRLNGQPVALNCDLIERAESTPDTILTLVDGTKYVIEQPVEEVIARIREFRASVLALAERLEVPSQRQRVLRVVHHDDGEG